MKQKEYNRIDYACEREGCRIKQKEYEHLYKVKYRKAPPIRFWLKLLKAWRYEFQSRFGIVKRRHRRSIAIRNLKRLYGLNLAGLLKTVNVFETPGYSHGIGCEHCTKRRLYAYYY